jgi:hypothetical protein
VRPDAFSRMWLDSTWTEIHVVLCSGMCACAFSTVKTTRKSSYFISVLASCLVFHAVSR